MIVDKALAKFSIFSKMLDGGDTGRERVEHRSNFQLRFTHHYLKDTGYPEAGVLSRLDYGPTGQRAWGFLKNLLRLA